MEPPSIVPSLADLEFALGLAEDRLARAPYIDNTQRKEAEESRCRAEIAHFKAEIEARRAETAEFLCHLWPTCGCPDGGVRHDCPALARARS